MKELRSVKPGFNLVCANLTVDLVVSERGGILNCLAPDGVLVVAGILTREFADVSRCYTADGLKLISSRGEKEWRSGVFRWRR
jgi:ribosomal protein L11 methylase PrmA